NVNSRLPIMSYTCFRRFRAGRSMMPTGKALLTDDYTDRGRMGRESGGGEGRNPRGDLDEVGVSAVVPSQLLR
ncbi:hypothetical protein GWI33_003699, partial [Rhynchophorus ferrugineus]